MPTSYTNSLFSVSKALDDPLIPASDHPCVLSLYTGPAGAGAPGDGTADCLMISAESGYSAPVLLEAYGKEGRPNGMMSKVDGR